MRDALLLRQTTVERANQLRALNRTVELLAREGIRKRNPGISEAGLFREMADLRLGADLAARVYGASADAR